MKISKAFFSVLLLLGIGLVLWAVFKPSSLDEPESQSYETVVGQFKSLGGIRVNRSISHLLEDEEGEIYYTFSDRYDLSDTRYATGLWEVYGLVMHYSDLDKDVLEVRRLSSAPETVTEASDAAMVHFESPTWGLAFDYPNDWTLTEGAATILLNSGAEQGSAIQIQKTAARLTQGPDQESSARLDEIRSFALTQSDLSGFENSENLVGPDQILSLKLQDPSSAKMSYLLPRFPDLLRLNFVPGTGEVSQTLNESNVFSKILTGLRFFPVGTGASTSVTTPITPVQEPVTASTPTSTSVTVQQVEFSKFANLESSTFGFKMSYPSSWYYLGDAGVYRFAAQDLEKDGSEALITMKLNSSEAAGTRVDGAKVLVTVKVEGRSYTLSGPAEYQKLMQTMADSIVKL